MIIALRDDVIIKRISPDNVGKIIIPKSAVSFRNNNLSNIGEVVSVGIKFNMTFDGKPLKTGDKIIYTQNEGRVFTVEGEKYSK
jgi:co-chaperonin GroES (HSP10)